MESLDSLNVGCGTSPTGTVNCDLYVKDVGHRVHGGREDLKPKQIKNFVICDALHLPFKTEAFPLVLCNHLIEHVETPMKLLGELLRVSSHQVLVHCPHKIGDRLLHRNAKMHIGFFNRSWFVCASEKFGVYCVTRIISECFLFLPLEIEVEFWKP